MELVQIIPVLAIIIFGGCIVGGIKTEIDKDAGIKRDQ